MPVMRFPSSAIESIKHKQALRLALGIVLLGAGGCHRESADMPQGGVSTTADATPKAGIEGGTAAATPASPAANPAEQPGVSAGIGPSLGSSSGATPPTTAIPTDMVLKARAFLARPEQDRDMQTALRARAVSAGNACPSMAFTPGQTGLSNAPSPVFDASGALVQGRVRQRFTMVGCPTQRTYTIFVVAAPGMPLRTIAGLVGTTVADLDLQEGAIPFAVAAARRLVPGCTQLAPVQTHLVGADPTANGAATTPWTEYWLVAGCGKLVATTLHFAPDPGRQTTTVRALDSESRILPAYAQ